MCVKDVNVGITVLLLVKVQLDVSSSVLIVPGGWCADLSHDVNFGPR